MSDWKAKRFWKEATVANEDGGYSVRLDGRSVKSPAKRALIMPTRAMAEVVAAEWNAQEEEIRPDLMPATRTVNSAVDTVAVQKAEVADMLAAYGDSDLLCYRADHPQGLVEVQSAQWDPVLDWAAETIGARLEPRTGIVHQPQDAKALQVLAERTHALTAYELAAFHDLVSLTGSLVLGFAVTEAAFAPEDVWARSRVDEEWQIAQWGRDEEAEAQTAIKKESFLHAERMFTLCRAR